MYVKTEMGFQDLMNECWAGASNTLETIEEAGKEDEFMDYLEEVFPDVPDLTELNDFLWFEDETIFRDLGIETDDEEEEEED